MKSRLLFIPVLIALALIALAERDGKTGEFHVDFSTPPIPADGNSTVNLNAVVKNRKLSADELDARVVQGPTVASIESARVDDDTITIRVRAGVMPGKALIQITAPGFSPVRLPLETTAVASDEFRDGTPDFARLGPEDTPAFVTWFTFLSEAQYYVPTKKLPREIADCGALLRFAYRETLRAHDSNWATQINLETLPSFPDVRKYRYPSTPLGAGLFRIRGGEYRAANLLDGTFAEFADAQTLQRFNTHLVSRNVRAARPGDLFFYRQLDQNMPFHAMIFLGQSHFEDDAEPRMVYHTGPIATTPGEIRRPTLQFLLDHPEPKWRPVESNRNFLGVYRWNILR